MPRVKPLVVCCWIAFGLIAALHGPLEAAGELANDFFCWVAAVTLHDPGEPVKHESAFAVSAHRLGGRPARPQPVSMSGAGFLQVRQCHTVPAIPQCKPDGGISFLVRSWSFNRRTAPAPRAPSSCA